MTGARSRGVEKCPEASMDRVGEPDSDSLGRAPQASSTGSPTPLCTQVPTYTQRNLWLRTVRETLEKTLDPLLRDGHQGAAVQRVSWECLRGMRDSPDTHPVPVGSQSFSFSLSSGFHNVLQGTKSQPRNRAQRGGETRPRPPLDGGDRGSCHGVRCYAGLFGGLAAYSAR